MNHEWHPIETVPRDRIVWLKCETRPDFGEHAMMWSHLRRRWEGVAFAPLRAIPTWWDESQPQPTHWRDTAATDPGQSNAQQTEPQT